MTHFEDSLLMDKRLNGLLALMNVALSDIKKTMDSLEMEGAQPYEILIPEMNLLGLPIRFGKTDDIEVSGKGINGTTVSCVVKTGL